MDWDRVLRWWYRHEDHQVEVAEKLIRRVYGIREQPEPELPAAPEPPKPWEEPPGSYEWPPGTAEWGDDR